MNVLDYIPNTFYSKVISKVNVENINGVLNSNLQLRSYLLEEVKYNKVIFNIYLDELKDYILKSYKLEEEIFTKEQIYNYLDDLINLAIKEALKLYKSHIEYYFLKPLNTAIEFLINYYDKQNLKFIDIEDKILNNKEEFASYLFQINDILFKIGYSGLNNYYDFSSHIGDDEKYDLTLLRITLTKFYPESIFDYIDIDELFGWRLDLIKGLYIKNENQFFDAGISPEMEILDNEINGFIYEIIFNKIYVKYYREILTNLDDLEDEINTLLFSAFKITISKLFEEYKHDLRGLLSFND